jgi:glutathione S-transferase
VRRTAISLKLLGIPFEHRAVSVFRHFDEFRAVNPVVKAPTFVCDDGTVLMDSGLILDFAETIAPPGRSLMPRDATGRRHALRTIGLALAACEKSISIVYERELRPAEKRHEPWVSRVTGQLLAACSLLEDDLAGKPLSARPGEIRQDGVTTAVTWGFLQMMVPEIVVASGYPRLAALSREAEALPEFVATLEGWTPPS